jgi:hypothetical protein
VQKRPGHDTEGGERSSEELHAKQVAPVEERGGDTEQITEQMVPAEVDADPDQHGRASQGQHDSEREADGEPLLEEEPRAESDDEGREVRKQGGVGDGGEADGCVPEGEVGGEKKAGQDQESEGGAIHRRGCGGGTAAAPGPEQG